MVQYTVRPGETPTQIAARFGRLGFWQDLVLLNSRLGIKRLPVTERGTGRALYTFVDPRAGGGYRAGVKLSLPVGWVSASTAGMVGFDDPGTPCNCNIGNDCPSGQCVNCRCTGAAIVVQPEGGNCVADAQCAQGLGCVNGKCAKPYDPCKADEVYINGKCQKLGQGMPGSTCSTDQDCLNGLGQCVNKICQHREDQGGCTPNGGSCAGGGKCCPGSVCSNGVCQAQYYAPPPCKGIGGNCTGDADCCSKSCVKGACAAKGGTVPDPKEPTPGEEKSSMWPWLVVGTLVTGAVIGGVWYAGSR